jgi:hypothetical protein
MLSRFEPLIDRRPHDRKRPESESRVPLVGVREQVRQLRLTNPHWSLGDIAQETGVTRERVRQLLEAEGLPTRRATPRSIIDAALSVMPAHATESDADSPTDQPEPDESPTSSVTPVSPFEGRDSGRDV